MGVTDSDRHQDVDNAEDTADEGSTREVVVGTEVGGNFETTEAGGNIGTGNNTVVGGNVEPGNITEVTEVGGNVENGITVVRPAPDKRQASALGDVEVIAGVSLEVVGRSEDDGEGTLDTRNNNERNAIHLDTAVAGSVELEELDPDIPQGTTVDEADINGEVVTPAVTEVIATTNTEAENPALTPEVHTTDRGAITKAKVSRTGTTRMVLRKRKECQPRDRWK